MLFESLWIVSLSCTPSAHYTFWHRSHIFLFTMLYSDHYHNPYHTINIDPEKPCWHHPSNAWKWSDALWAPDNPSLSLLCPNPLKHEQKLSLYHAMSWPCLVLGHEQIEFESVSHMTESIYNANKPCTICSLNKNLVVNFAQILTDLGRCYTKRPNYNSQQFDQEVRDLTHSVWKSGYKSLT